MALPEGKVHRLPRLLHITAEVALGTAFLRKFYLGIIDLTGAHVFVLLLRLG
jgi:hypothetical protein